VCSVVIDCTLAGEVVTGVGPMGIAVPVAGEIMTVVSA
jgi:hypothetical protein